MPRRKSHVAGASQSVLSVHTILMQQPSPPPSGTSQAKPPPQSTAHRQVGCALAHMPPPLLLDVLFPVPVVLVVQPTPTSNNNPKEKTPLGKATQRCPCINHLHP